MKRIILLMIVCIVAFASCSKKTGQYMRADESMKKGMEYFKRGKYEKSIPLFENTLMEAETPEMAAKAQLLLADAYFLDKSYEEAIPAYEQFLEIYEDTPDANTALLRLGLSHYAMVSTIDRDMAAVEGALGAFAKLRDKSPAFAREYELNKKIVELRGMLAEREVYVAEFYIRIGKPDAADKRLLHLIDKYSDTKSYEDGLYIYAGRLAQKDGQEVEAVKYYRKLIKERPNSRYGLDVARELTTLLAKITSKLEKEEVEEEN